MDAKYSVIYKGEVVETMVMAEVELNLQKRYQLSEQKSKELLSNPRIIKQGLTQEQALHIQKSLLGNGLKTHLHNEFLQTDASQSEPQTHPTDATIKLNKASAKNETSAAGSFDKNEIDKIFSGSMPTIDSSFSYNAGLFATLLLTLCIPFLYINITALVVFNTGSFIVNLSDWFDFQHNAVIKFFVAISLIFMGLLLSFFLLRPLIPQNYRHSDEVLDPASHPNLFYLVKKLSAYMSVPMPCEIRMNNQVNASASLKDGIKSIKQGELVLTLGYPLVSGMNTRQLVGVIAHEFGHFSQRNGMAVYYLINTINYWLQERAYADYGLALLLKRWREKTNSDYLLIPIMTASAGIWLSQQLLKRLFHMSLYCSQHMSRLMEFNADHHECKIVGSQTFTDTSLRLHQLSYASQKVAEINEFFWNENVLLKNIPKAINTLTNELEKHEKQSIQDSIDLQRSHPWDSHPANNQRIDHAQALNEEGIFHLELDASVLFNHYTVLCEEATLAVYNGNTANKFNDKVVANDTLLATHKEDQDSVKLIRIAQFGVDLQGRLPTIPAELPVKLQRASLKDIDGFYLDIQQLVKENIARYCQLRDKRVLHSQAFAYVEAGFKVNNEDFGLTPDEANHVSRTLDTTRSNFHDNETSFSRYDQLVTARLFANLNAKPSRHLLLAHPHLEALKVIKGLEKDLHQIEIYDACIKMLLNDKAGGMAIKQTIERYRVKLAALTESVMQQIATVDAVNRFSDQPMSLLDFAHSWHAKPELEVNVLRASHLAHYAATIYSSLMKQHNLHLRKLLLISQS